MDETLIPKILIYGTPILAIIIVITIFIVKQQRDLENKIKADESERKLKYESEKKLFESKGCTLSKKIGELLIDDIHKKWMVTTDRIVYEYSDIVSVSIAVNGNQMTSNMFSTASFQTINSLSVNITTKDVLNPIVEIQLLPFSNLGYDTTSYVFSEFQKIALQQDATINAIINQNTNYNITSNLL